MMQVRCDRHFGARAQRLVIALCLCTVALVASAASPTDVVVVLDNSGSMKANDPTFLLKRAVANFITALDPDTHIGVIMFDEKVHYAVPLAALDVDTRASIQTTIDGIDYRGKLTNSPAAIERAIYELKTTARPDAARIVLFMTDGIVDTGNAAADDDKANWMRTELAADAKDNGIRIFGIAFTDNADFFLIQSLAQKTGGEYFRALKPDDLNGVFGTVQQRLAAAPAIAEPVPTAVPAPTVPDVATAPQPTAPSAAAEATPCLAGMTADERSGIEEAAAQSGTTGEALCLELQGAPTGTAVVVPPPQSTEDDTLGVMIIAGAAVVLAGVVIAAVMMLRRRGVKPPRPTAPTGSAVDPAPVPEAFIKDISGAAEDPAMQLTAKPLIVGRVAGNDPAHIDYFVVNKATIGRRHAMIKYRDYGFWLADQGSVNGTFLNGERIDNERQLKHGDRIKFHKYEFEFSLPEMDDGGRTLFADASEATMIGDAATLDGRRALATMATPAIAAVAAADAEEDDVFDLTGGADLPSTAPAPVDDLASDQTAATAFSPRKAPTPVSAFEDDDEDYGNEDELVTVAPNFTPGATAAQAEFDAEASAFFDDGALGVTSGPPMQDFEFDAPESVRDTEDDEFSGADTAIRPATTPNYEDEGETDTVMLSLAPAAAREEADSVTLLPGVVSRSSVLEATSDISVDDFMKTDSFEIPLPGMSDDDIGDDGDATLLPGEVPALSAGALNDVFDVTAEGTIPPVPPGSHLDDDDDDAPTQFLR